MRKYIKKFIKLKKKLNVWWQLKIVNKINILLKNIIKNKIYLYFFRLLDSFIDEIIPEENEKYLKRNMILLIFFLNKKSKKTKVKYIFSNIITF